MLSDRAPNAAGMPRPTICGTWGWPKSRWISLGACWASAAKVLRGGMEAEMLAVRKRGVASVKHVKPPASRKDSAEMEVVALGFRGGAL